MLLGDVLDLENESHWMVALAGPGTPFNDMLLDPSDDGLKLFVERDFKKKGPTHLQTAVEMDKSKKYKQLHEFVWQALPEHASIAPQQLTRNIMIDTDFLLSFLTSGDSSHASWKCSRSTN